MAPGLCAECSGIALTGPVTCSGQCRRSFHSWCAGLSPVGFEAWKSDPAMFWFCADCRRELQPKKEDQSAADYTKCLPPELLTQVFQHLENQDLLQIRLVCHRWREIVDGTTMLIGRFEIQFRWNHPTASLTKNYEPLNFPPVTKMFMAGCDIETVSHWWPPIGERLVHLRLLGGRVASAELRSMLHQAPHLKSLRLELSRIDSIGSTQDGDLQLAQLEEFRFRGDVAELLRAFGLESFTQLKVVCLHAYGVQAVQYVLAVLRSAQDTLKDVGLICPFDRNMLVELSKISRLRPRRLTLGTVADQPKLLLTHYTRWLNFFQMQVDSLEELSFEYYVYPTNAILCSIGRACPNLKRFLADLTLEADERLDEQTSFMNFTPKLQYLNIRTFNDNIDLTCNGTHGLKELVLQGTINYRFAEFLKNIQQMELELSPPINWEGLFGALEQLNSLQHLRLCVLWNPTSDETCKVTKTFSKLTKLYMGGSITYRMLGQILRGCSRLEILEIDTSKLGPFDDAVFGEFFETTKWLRKLVMKNDEQLSSRMLELLAERNIQLVIDHSLQFQLFVF